MGSKEVRRKCCCDLDSPFCGVTVGVMGTNVAISSMFTSSSPRRDAPLTSRISRHTKRKMKTNRISILIAFIVEKLAGIVQEISNVLYALHCTFHVARVPCKVSSPPIFNESTNWLKARRPICVERDGAEENGTIKLIVPGQ